ncbi:MAG: hypothetical protein L6R39_007791, partial [Caloplaca ligustica]
RLESEDKEDTDAENIEGEKLVYIGVGKRDDVPRGKRKNPLEIKVVARKWVRGVGFMIAWQYGGMRIDCVNDEAFIFGTERIRAEAREAEALRRYVRS